MRERRVPERRGVLFVLCSMVLTFLPAQETTPPTIPPPAVQSLETDSQGSAGEPDDLLTRTIIQDIVTASFFELAAWCRRLGLPATGDRETLKARLFSYYGITPPETPPPAGRRITLSSARVARYTTRTEVDEEYVELGGGVVLEFSDDQGEHTIMADLVVYNAALKTLSAYGNVGYVKRRAGKEVERFSGNFLLVKVEDASGLFLSGTFSQEKKIEDEPLTFGTTADEASRYIVGEDEAVISRDVRISSSRGDPPYYQLAASRLWLFGQSDWAVEHAVLKVGEIPVLYIPFFFYAGDELVFHPVFGIDERRGTFLQTTTYVVGHKPLSTEGAFSFMAPSEDQSFKYVRHGLFIHRIPVAPLGDQEADSEEEAGLREDRLKLMLDYYTGLGLFAGMEGNWKSLGPLSGLDLQIGLARSRTLFPSGDGYTPYTLEEGEVVSRWDESYFGSTELPLRYRLSSEGRLNIPRGSLSWKIMALSDPYVAPDFLDRKEDIAWKQVFGFSDGTDADTTPSEEPSISWLLRGSVSPGLSLGTLFRWTSVSLSNTLLWGVKSRSDVPSTSPERTYFYPTSLVLPSLSLSFSGTLLSYPGGGRASETSPELPEGFLPPWETDESEETSEGPPEGPFGQYLLPSLFDDLSLSSSLTPLRLSSAYAMTPQWVSTYYYPSDIDSPEDVELSSPSYGKHNLRFTDTFTNTATFYDGFGQLSAQTTFSVNRYYPMRLDDEMSDDTWEGIRDPILRQNDLYLEQRVQAVSKPFLLFLPLKDSSISYTIRARIVDEEVTDISPDGLPRYDYHFVEWEDDYIKEHKVQSSLVLSVLGTRHTLSASYVLPPLDEEVSFGLSDTMGPWTQTTALNYQRGDGDSWEFESLSFTQKLSFLENNLQFTENLKLVPDEDDASRIRPEQHVLTAKLYPLTIQATWLHTYPYTFGGYGVGWIREDEKEFLLSKVSARLGYTSPDTYLWKNRMGIRATTSSTYTITPIRVTDSRWDLSFGLSFFIQEFVEVSLSSVSVNRAAYRYIPGLPEKVGLEWVNPLVDIARSFNFFSVDDREEALFKLQSLDLSVTHHLSDWYLSFSYSGEPATRTTDAGILETYWDSSFSLTLAWKPIPEIETNLDYEDAAFQF